MYGNGLPISLRRPRKNPPDVRTDMLWVSASLCVGEGSEPMEPVGYHVAPKPNGRPTSSIERRPLLTHFRHQLRIAPRCISYPETAAISDTETRLMPTDYCTAGEAPNDLPIDLAAGYKKAPLRPRYSTPIPRPGAACHDFASQPWQLPRMLHSGRPTRSRLRVASPKNGLFVIYETPLVKSSYTGMPMGTGQFPSLFPGTSGLATASISTS